MCIVLIFKQNRYMKLNITVFVKNRSWIIRIMNQSQVDQEEEEQKNAKNGSIDKIHEELELSPSQESA